MGVERSRMLAIPWRVGSIRCHFRNRLLAILNEDYVSLPKAICVLSPHHRSFFPRQSGQFSADMKEPPPTSGQPQLQEASMSSSVNSSAAAAPNTSGSSAPTAAKRGRPSDSSTPGGEEPDTDISLQNKRLRRIFNNGTESPQVGWSLKNFWCGMGSRIMN